MPNLNKVFLMGNLTRDPELKYTAKGTPVVNCGIAVNEKWTDANGDKQESAVFVDFTVWSKPAETFAQYLRKGSGVQLTGKLKLETWDQDGDKRSKLIVIVEEFQFLDRKENNEDSRPQDQSRTNAVKLSGQPAKPASRPTA